MGSMPLGDSQGLQTYCLKQTQLHSYDRSITWSQSITPKPPPSSPLGSDTLFYIESRFESVYLIQESLAPIGGLMKIRWSSAGVGWIEETGGNWGSSRHRQGRYAGVGGREEANTQRRHP